MSLSVSSIPISTVSFLCPHYRSYLSSPSLLAELLPIYLCIRVLVCRTDDATSRLPTIPLLDLGISVHEPLAGDVVQ
jgi:hypothetical protein